MPFLPPNQQRQSTEGQQRQLLVTTKKITTTHQLNIQMQCYRKLVAVSSYTMISSTLKIAAARATWQKFIGCSVIQSRELHRDGDYDNPTVERERVYLLEKNTHGITKQ